MSDWRNAVSLHVPPTEGDAYCNACGLGSQYWENLPECPIEPTAPYERIRELEAQLTAARDIIAIHKNGAISLYAELTAQSKALTTAREALEPAIQLVSESHVANFTPRLSKAIPLMGAALAAIKEVA